MVRMRSVALLFALSVLLFAPAVRAADNSRPVRARFELLGMLRESPAKTPDTAIIERFDAKEVDAMARFEELLRDFCEQEKIPADYRKSPEPETGTIVYLSPEIARTLWQYYQDEKLDDSLMAEVSNEELLGYVAGVYSRFGNEKMRPIILQENGRRRLETLGRVLARLGCRRLLIYGTGTHFDLPVYALTFSPTRKVAWRLGILGSVTLDQLGAFSKSLTFLEEIPTTATQAQVEEDLRDSVSEMTNWKPDLQAWRLTLEAKPQPFLRGQPMNLELRMTNISKRAATLGKWRDTWSDYDLSVTDAAGHPVELTPEGHRWLRPTIVSGHLAFPELAPTDADLQTVDLAKLFDLSAPGKYRVTAGHNYFPGLPRTSLDFTVE
jgi:hypothetical protein